MPQMGLAIAIEIPDALAEAAVHRYRSVPECTPRSLFRKIERKGKAKLKPKIAMNSANHSAARLRRQFTPPLLIGGVVWRGSVDRGYSPRISTMRSDVMGRRSTTASGLRLRSASSTAFEIAAGAGIVPLSPAPLKPSGFASVGVDMWTSSGSSTSPVLTIV